MKGSVSEFELGVIRSRMYEAARSKARRGELRTSAPIGYIWDRQVGLGLDPDARLREVIRLVFQKFRELGSARQVLLWMASQGIHFPYPTDRKTLTSFEWRPIRYRNVIAILKNPFYAGVYAYGKSEKRTEIVDGRARKTYGHTKPMAAWEVFIKEHHEGYISWPDYERNQTLLAGNAYGRICETKSGRGGRAVLVELLCCAKCGRRLSVAYTGRYLRPIYRCDKPNLQLGQKRCISVAGKRIDAAVASEMLRAITPMAIEAAAEAERMLKAEDTDRRRIVELELQQATYDASLAERRYACARSCRSWRAQGTSARRCSGGQRIARRHRGRRCGCVSRCARVSRSPVCLDAPVIAVGGRGRGDAVRCWIGEELFDLGMQQWVVALEGEAIVRTFVDDGQSNLALRAHRINRNQRAGQFETLQEMRNSSDFIRLLVDGLLAENQALPCRPSRNDMQGIAAFRTRVRAP